jgi:hypothetical protein
LFVVDADDLADPEVLGILICIRLNSNPQARGKVELVDIKSGSALNNPYP